MKTFCFFALFSALLLSAAPVELMTRQEEAGSWQGMVRFAPASARGRGACFVLYGRYPTPLIYKNYIPVEDGKSYTLKVSFRPLDPKQPVSGYMGLQLFDKNKKLIGIRNVRAFENTESTVVRAKKGEKTVTVKMIRNISKMKNYSVAFHVKKDFSDLPNFDLSARGKGFKTDKNGDLCIELQSALKKDYPAGTPVRLHSAWSPTLYFLGSGWVKEKGLDHKAVLTGIMKGQGAPARQFWKGTKFVRPFVWFGNWNRRPKEGAKLLVDGFSFTVSEK